MPRKEIKEKVKLRKGWCGWHGDYETKKWQGELGTYQTCPSCIAEQKRSRPNA